MVFVSDPFDARGFFLAVIFALTQFLHLAADKHVLQLRVALLELTSLLLLRDELTPLKFERIDILRQLGLHVMRCYGEVYHIVLGEFIDKIYIGVRSGCRQTKDSFVGLLAFYRSEVQVSGLQNTVVGGDERQTEGTLVCTEEAERIDAVARSMVLQ